MQPEESPISRRPQRLGLRLAACGALAMLAAAQDTVAVSIPTGIVLIAAGLTFVTLALEAQTSGLGLIPLLLGLVALVSGVCWLIWPAMQPVSWTALLATYGLLSGGLMVVFGSRLKPLSGWGRIATAGLIAIAIGFATWSQMPLAGEWTIGFLTGASLLVMGSALCVSPGFASATSDPTGDDTDMSI